MTPKTIRQYCPKCSKVLSIAEIIDQWCEFCGKEIIPSHHPVPVCQETTTQVA